VTDYDRVPAFSEHGVTEGDLVRLRCGKVGTVMRERLAEIANGKCEGYAPRWCVRLESGGTKGFESVEALKVNAQKLRAVRW
jgi:hypothetical protein